MSRHYTSAPKLLHIIEHLGRGGAEIALVYLLPALRACGFHCELAILRQPYEGDQVLENAGIVVHHLGIGPGWSVYRALGKLVSLIRRREFDIIHAHLFPATFYCAMTKALLAAPRRVVTFHNLDYDLFPPNNLKRKVMKRAAKVLMRHCIDAHVAVSRSVAEHYRSALQLESITVIENALNTQMNCTDVDRRWIRAPYGFCGEDFLMIMPCRFVLEKGHRYLLEAIELLRLRGICAKALLLGRGPLMEQLVNDVSKRGLAGDVKVFPSLPHDKLMQVIQASDLFVMPSTHEGFPVTPAEAMLLGIPVLATSVGGIPELIENGVSGILVEPKNSTVLADEICRFFCDAQLRLRIGGNGRKRVIGNFSTEALLPRWQRLYGDVLSQSSN